MLLREEVRLRKAAELIAEQAKPIPKAQADAREAIWTPDKEPEGEDAPADREARRAVDAGQLTPDRPTCLDRLSRR